MKVLPLMIALLCTAPLLIGNSGCEEGGQSNTDLSAQDSRPIATAPLQLPYCRPGETPGDTAAPCQVKK